jgi:hypothetical protein
LAAPYVKASQRDLFTHLCSRGHEIGDIMKKRAHINTASMLNVSVAMPDVPPLEVDRLTSNEVVFEIVP